MNSILLDINICLDIMLKRIPFAENSGRSIELAISNQWQLVVAASSFDTIYYLLRKFTGATEATSILKTFRSLVKIGLVDTSVIDAALNAQWSDFEDAIQYYCAQHNECNIILTRNSTDFETQSELPEILSPTGFLNRFA